MIVAALVKTVTLRPKLNRFYANENYYQRNKVTAGFVIKKEFADGSEEAVALLAMPHRPSTIDTDPRGDPPAASTATPPCSRS